jgi:hypothetical protein
VWGAPADIYNTFAQTLPVEAVAEVEEVIVFVRSTVLWPFKHVMLTSMISDWHGRRVAPASSLQMAPVLL